MATQRVIVTEASLPTSGLEKKALGPGEAGVNFNLKPPCKDEIERMKEFARLSRGSRALEMHV